MNHAAIQRHAAAFAICLALTACAAGARASAQADRAPDPFGGTLIEIVAEHRFASGRGADLRPSEEGAVRVSLPRLHPGAANASKGWLFPGLDGPHPLLDGRYRYGTYEAILTELFAGSMSPELFELGEVADRLLDGIEAEMTFVAAAEHLRARSAALPRAESRELVASLEDIEGWGDVSVERSLENGTLRVFVMSALNHGRVRARVDAISPLVLASRLHADGAFRRAFQEATLGVQRRQSLRRQVMKDKIWYNRHNGSSDTIARTRVELLPAAAARVAFAQLGAEGLANMEIDHTLQADAPVTIQEFLRLEAGLDALATIERGLFGGEGFTTACPERGSERELWRFRAYLGHYAHALLGRMHDLFDDRFFSERLRWNAPPDARDAFRERMAARRDALEHALVACASLRAAVLETAGEGRNDQK